MCQHDERENCLKIQNSWLTPSPNTSHSLLRTLTKQFFAMLFAQEIIKRGLKWFICIENDANKWCRLYFLLPSCRHIVIISMARWITNSGFSIDCELTAIVRLGLLALSLWLRPNTKSKCHRCRQCKYLHNDYTERQTGSCILLMAFGSTTYHFDASQIISNNPIIIMESQPQITRDAHWPNAEKKPNSNESRDERGLFFHLEQSHIMC